MSKIKWSIWNPHWGIDKEGNHYLRVGAWQSYLMSVVKAIVILTVIIMVVGLIFRP